MFFLFALAMVLAMAVLFFVAVIGIVSAIAWLLWSGIVALAMAVLGALLVTAMLTGSADLSSTTALVSGAAIFVLALAAGNAMRRRRRLRRRRTITTTARVIETPPAPVAASPPVADADDGGDPVLAAAWNRLAEASDFARSRISHVRSSCARFLAMADARADNADAAEFALLIRKRVPERIDECLAECRVLTALETRATLEETVADLERLGAIADKRRSALIDANGGPGQRRSLLARRLDADPYA